MITGTEHPALVGPVGAAPFRGRDGRDGTTNAPDVTNATNATETETGAANAVTAIELAQRLGARRCGDSWRARCPAHDDRTPSLSIHENERGIGLKCFAGCDVKSICAALNIQVRDLFYNKATLAVALPKNARFKQRSHAVTQLRSNVVYSVSRISEEKHSPNSHVILTPTLTPTLTSTLTSTVERILIAMLASVQDSGDASAHIASEGKQSGMKFQDMAKLWTPEEKLAHRSFKSKARSSGFRKIWGMALRHAKAGNTWFPIKESYLRDSLGYKDKRCTYDFIKALCELEVLVPHPANDALDRKLYRWALSTNIWNVDDDEPIVF